MNPDSVPQEFYEDAAARDASPAIGGAGISDRLQDLIGRCMSLEADLEKQGLRCEDVSQARLYLVWAASRLEIPLRSKVSGESGPVEVKE